MSRFFGQIKYFNHPKEVVMFRSWFIRDKDGQVPKMKLEPKAPYEVGEVTDLIEGKVDFLIEKIAKSDWSDTFWKASGKALVRLPAVATEIDIKPVTNNRGDIKSFAIRYFALGKKNIIILNRTWTDHDDDGKETCELVVDEVEV